MGVAGAAWGDWLDAVRAWRWPVATGVGVAVGVVVGLARADGPPGRPGPQPGYERELFGADVRHRAEAFRLRCRVADLEAERDQLRRELMRRPALPPACGGGGPELIPPQDVPTRPEG